MKLQDLKPGRAMGSHQSSKMITDVWLTPPPIIKSLGEFDLDPCSPINRPWDTAKHHYTIEDNGLIKQWFGRVWLNPPYGSEAAKWMKLMADHYNGIALIFARTETEMFFEHVWKKAISLLFIEGRLHFHVAEDTEFKRKGKPSILVKRGEAAHANSGAPSVLISYGSKNVDALANSGIEGAHIIRNYTPVLFVGIHYTWKRVVEMSLERLDGLANIDTIYKMVEKLAPAKARNNQHYKAKIRQQLQTHFNRIQKGVYSLN